MEEGDVATTQVLPVEKEEGENVMEGEKGGIMGQLISDVVKEVKEDNEGEEREGGCESGKEEESSQTFRLSSNGALCLEFLEDQGREDNFTDLDLICCDGYIQVHRCLLIGASAFLRELLIDKDLMDTTAISLPDVSVRHLRLVLGLVYSGRAIIDGGDEVEIFETMNMLGLPVTDLLCRSAKTNDKDQVAVMRNNVSDDSGTCSSGDVSLEHDEGDNLQKCGGDDEGKIADDKQETNFKPKEDRENKGELDRGGPMSPADGNYEEDHLPQITSTTGDSESLIDFVPSSQEKNFNTDFKAENPAKESDFNEYKMKADKPSIILGLLGYEGNQNADAIPMSDDEGSGKDVIINEESDRNSDVESLIDQESQSQSIIASQHSILSDFEDLNFEEACNDLQKQVAKPIKTTPTPSCSSGSVGGNEMTLRKRKISDSVEDTKLSSDDGQSRMTTRSIGSNNGSKTPAKKKRTTPKKPSMKQNTATNGTAYSSPGENNQPKAKGKRRRTSNKSKERSPDVESISSVKTRSSDCPSQERMSTCSSSTENMSRILLEVKELKGVKYNVYGFMDPIQGIQSGKTIAIEASKDKYINCAPLTNKK